ncbi:MAG: phenylalanine--tRNA ligase subunit beta [Pseudomonadota bacterium]|nr:phenylalanine--tRNA ligase subunit beta [Pseudomonadota bacterium]
MKFTYSWLKELLDTDVSVEQLCSDLTQLGHEVEEVEDHAESLKKVVIGHVLERTQHPDADKLGICKVEVGEDSPRQIVCGAPNVRAGLTVAVALDGAVLPGDFKIKPTKIRGVESNGMICSARELELGEDHDGIMELECDAKPGSDFASAMGYDDTTIEVAITPNRGDALSVLGLARDLAALGTGTLKALPTAEGMAKAGDVSVNTDTENCALFSTVKIEGLKNTSSPDWMQQRLKAAGQRPIDAIVDVTNYIALTYGQPLHAYDISKMNGLTLTARMATEGDSFEALDEKTYTLKSTDIGIYNGDTLVGLGGIMGGETTAVDENTTDILLEAAHFDKDIIASTGQRLMILSEARHRFERGVDAHGSVNFGAVAAGLITDICGGGIKGQAVAGEAPAESRKVTFDTSRMETFAGLAVKTSECESILTKLGFTVKATGGSVLEVTPPTFRTMMDTDADLIEEVLRVKGYDQIPTVLPELPEEKTKASAPMLSYERHMRRKLATLGYTEALTYSFISREHARAFTSSPDTLVELENPIDQATMSTLRPSLVPGLLAALKAGISRGEQHVKLAEVGKAYDEKSGETWMACGLMYGAGHDAHWHNASTPADIFDVKADALACLEAMQVRADRMQISRDAGTSYHPGRSGSLRLGKNAYATFGEIHPSILKSFGIKGRVCVFEINISACAKTPMKGGAYAPSSFQASSRDFAFVLDKGVDAEQLLRAFNGADKTLVKSVSIFDVYEGDKLPEGKKSVALRVVLQSGEKTLTDEEINTICDKAVKTVETKLGGELRA